MTGRILLAAMAILIGIRGILSFIHPEIVRSPIVLARDKKDTPLLDRAHGVAFCLSSL